METNFSVTPPMCNINEIFRLHVRFVSDHARLCMRVKVFTSSGPFNGVHGKLRRAGNHRYTMNYAQTLEMEINRWLAENPAIKVLRTEQSISRSWFGRHCCVVTVWYEPPRNVLTRPTAEQLVLDCLRQDHPMDGNQDTVVITDVIERPFGWVFSYNSKAFVSTGDEDHALLGCYPILVDKYDSSLHRTGLEPIEVYIRRYEAMKSTMGEPGTVTKSRQPASPSIASETESRNSPRPL